MVCDYGLPVPADGKSKELRPLIKKVYRITTLDFMSIGAIDILDGVERTLPKSHVIKLNINDLTKMQFSLQQEYSQQLSWRLCFYRYLDYA